MSTPAAPFNFRRVPLSGALLRTRIIAVLRAQDSSRMNAAADILVANGIRCLEVATTTKGALDAVERLAGRLPAGVDVGLGTVMTPGEALRAADAGARFIVAPHTATDVIHAARNLGLASHPGALTPSEIQLAWRAGASAVTLFPAGPLGTAYLAAVLAPLPHIDVIPAGSLSLAETAGWLAAGATAVGLGGSLLGDALSPGGDLDALAERTRRVCAAAESVPRRDASAEQ
ncbi:bifunctional 4-hydroxy-2-oxoglutarate aldolase/2-dehydro-3-deoxy-phosphogluconate aldolase [Arthrobacter sp. zg-Y820]|uniref:bifunctional 4-hydroxy-2-oxoglutarate aldolase/2-dehydro-3-deoxy-phosphogluconate aldolase n=1 Tax=unclassified Arthrobacter TaxID=235627 RepID=UPI001E605E0C|nr:MULTISPECIES: bifunctional 4-hydroxy-2-oxoglutarate aldolase/2-dehydro-3-deoxy-phosphogluconate aldolase [unclassified Arthrobacter]MCC9198569.1 bifunctional 4-hydroxy-2-oxoglutarate aldolase/2-dehydro-3-deoxy-phosphogluconate aldolase [Arthrobacter sp. zg-Y820]MDK1281439.1 bifunctional 4-hydroxy-2-oxoglutarate aldolase/2-dehydro-3-deoxy-phosphogluconate aldolase [Arthrobacter sp. zg.Y820]WIB09881.1 bifunctional 4-hydroxy-2-oxoglutarate aldolase/2-dehydro-3-deoxy-phosphogluconate aldolase [Ar